MKTSHFIIIILALALGFFAYLYMSVANNDKTAVAAADSTATTNAVIENILTRCSVRTYSDKEVSDSQIDTLLRAAMAAPTAVDRRPWQFIVIRDRAALDSIAANCRNISMAGQANVAIAVCGDMTLALDGDAQAYWIQDCSAATENLLLAANAMGLGAVWCGIYPIQERVDFIRNLLDLPEDAVPLNIIPIGYPSTETTPKEKYDSTRIHIY